MLLMQASKLNLDDDGVFRGRTRRVHTKCPCGPIPFWTKAPSNADNLSKSQINYPSRSFFSLLLGEMLVPLLSYNEARKAMVPRRFAFKKICFANGQLPQNRPQNSTAPKGFGWKSKTTRPTNKATSTGMLASNTAIIYWMRI